MEATNSTAEREISTTRVFEVPRQLVWKVWTDPKHLQHWWGPNGFTTTTKEFDLRAGGKWLFTMHGPDGTDYRNDIAFTNVVEPELLEWIHGPSPVFNITVYFYAEGETRTKLSMQMLFSTKQERDRTVEKFGAIEGQRQTMNRLEEYLKTYGENK